MVPLRILLVGCFVVAVAALLALVVRARLRRVPRLRSRLVWSGVAVIVVAAILIFWIPTKVPDTPGSPATMVLVMFFWFLGAGLFLVGLSALLGAGLAFMEEKNKRGAPPR